jgi:hypothetical protein
MERHRLARLASACALLIGLTAIATSAGAANEPSPRLTSPAIAAAQPACDRFVAAVRPYLIGAGVDDLIEQIQAFRSARSRLAQDLDVAITGPRDRRKAGPLITSLSHNGLLSGALAQINKDRIGAAFATLARWHRQTVREDRIARRIGLRRCVDVDLQQRTS